MGIRTRTMSTRKPGSRKHKSRVSVSDGYPNFKTRVGEHPIIYNFPRNYVYNKLKKL